MFGTLHIVVLCITAALILLGTYRILKLSFEKVCALMLGIGLAAELIMVFAYILMNEKNLGGYLPKGDLPLHLCSFQVLFFLVLVFGKNENTKRILRSFMLPTCLFGGLAAILIPTSSSVSRLNVLTFEYFIYHGAIVVFALRMLLGKDTVFTVRDYASCLAMLLVTMFAAVYINSILYNGTADTSFFYEVTDGTHKGLIQLTPVNFMYVVAPPQSGLPFLNKDKGWAVYFMRYLSLCVAAVTAVYIKPILRALGKKNGAVSHA